MSLPKPSIHSSAVILPGATVYGHVEIGPRAFILFGAVVRAEYDRISIGAETNIQDNAVIHCDEGFPCLIGDQVTVGHLAAVHGATIASKALIGIGAAALNGSTVGEGAWLGAGAVLPEGRAIPPWTLALGTPARVVRDLTEEEARGAADGVGRYLNLAATYRDAVANS